MKKRNKPLFVGMMLLVIAVVSLGSVKLYLNYHTQEKQEEELSIVTSFFPMYIATENITKGAEHIKLTNLSEPQTGCLHDYQLTPEDMKLLSKADVFIINGGGIEEFLTEVAKAYPDLTIIDASQGLDLMEDNSHAWMSVPLHREQVANISAGLETIDPDNAEIYQLNAADYDRKLADLEKQQNQILASSQGKQIVIFHEAYEYVARDYGMEVAFVLDLDEERQVSAGEVADVMDAVSSGSVSFVLAEEEYGKDMGDRVTEETGVPVYYLNTLVRGTYDANSYLEKMQENINIIEMALGLQND